MQHLGPELDMTVCPAGMPLKQFSAAFFQPYALEDEGYREECQVDETEMAPLPSDRTSAGASVSGL